jgi:hypothetical protein
MDWNNTHVKHHHFRPVIPQTKAEKAQTHLLGITTKAKHHHFRPVVPQVQAEKTQTHVLGITTQAKHHNFSQIKALNTKHIGNNIMR